MKILWISEYEIPSGFARVSKALIKQLQKRFDITVLDWYSEKESFVDGVKVLGKKSKEDKLGIEKMMNVYSGYDMIFILNDVWNIAKYLKALKSSKFFSVPKIAVYFPVDGTHHNAEWYKDFDIVTQAVTYTNFAAGVIKECTDALDSKLSIIPHGVDTDVFFKSQTDKASIREHVYGTKGLNDAFIFMNANRNQPRKKLDITVRAFAEFLKISGAADAYLHLHCGLVDYGVNIVELIKRFGVDDRIIVSTNESGMPNFSSEQLNLYYNAADVGLNSSMAEGWGLTNVEHAMSGAPQIVPNHSACKELYDGNALLIDSPTETVFYETITVGRIPDYRHMAKCMLAYYQNYELRTSHGDGLKNKFSQPEYSWSKIANDFGDLFLKD